MSPIRTIRKVSTFLVVIALLLARLASINGAVACFGSDGHFAFESAHVAGDASRSDSDLRLNQSSQSSAVTVQYLVNHTLSASCFDVSVAHASEQQAIAGSNHVTPDIGAIALLPVSVLDVAPPQLVQKVTFIRGPPGNAGFLLQLRSVVLLI